MLKVELQELITKIQVNPKIPRHRIENNKGKDNCNIILECVEKVPNSSMIKFKLEQKRLE